MSTAGIFGTPGLPVYAQSFGKGRERQSYRKSGGNAQPIVLESMLQMSNSAHILAESNLTIVLPVLRARYINSSFLLVIEQDATGSRTITWGGNAVKWPAGTPPTASTTAGSFDVYSFFNAGRVFWFGQQVGKAYA